ncbi:MAG: GTPase-associated system all-helical protein GASH [Thermomicrobiales bacterium]
MAKLPQMTTDFARWYAETFMDEGARRDLRWKGVVDVAANADHKTVEVLIRLAFPTPVPASGRKSENLTDVHAALMRTISGGDTTFDPSHSGRELQVLAATVLDRLLLTMSDAALVVTTASLAGTRKPDLPMDLAGLAEAALVKLSERKHVRQDFEEINLAAPKVGYNFNVEILETMQADEVQAEFDRLHDATTAAIERVVAGQNRVVKALHDRQVLDEEELQMLWWLTGGYSHVNEKPFAKIDDKLRPFSLAHELAGMTAVSPGPGSIRAMLLRAGVGLTKMKLADAVNAPGDEWAKEVSNSTLVSPVTTPIHFALEQRAELGSIDTWQAAWSGLTGLPVDLQLPAVKLAELFYREHVFLTMDA